MALLADLRRHTRIPAPAAERTLFLPPLSLALNYAASTLHNPRSVWVGDIRP